MLMCVSEVIVNVDDNDDNNLCTIWLHCMVFKKSDTENHEKLIRPVILHLKIV